MKPGVGRRISGGGPVFCRFGFFLAFLLGTPPPLRRLDCAPSFGLRTPPGFRGRPASPSNSESKYC
eukprot:9490619-Pyramimonas_sp.AAC.1